MSAFQPRSPLAAWAARCIAIAIAAGGSAASGYA